MGRITTRRLTKNDEPLLVYCRKCKKTKKEIDFYDATDKYLDSNGKMSVCKACIDDIFLRMMESEHTIERAILKVCRMMNIRYDEAALQATRKQLDGMIEKGKEPGNVFGIYKGKLIPVQKIEIGKRDENIDLTFYEPSKPYVADCPDDIPEIDELRKTWGSGFDYEDYVYLERELAEWKQTHKCDNKAELTLLKYIVYKQLDIEKARIEGKSTSTLVKEMQELMKTAAIDPAKANQAMSGKALDTFGMWIKDIEQFDPAEWWNENRKKYIDMDGIGLYFQNFFIRALKNFLGLSRDFTISSEAGMSDQEDNLDTDDFPFEEDGNGNIT